MDGLHSALHNHEVEVKFTKVDGSERIMRCTLKEDAITTERGPMTDGVTQERPVTVTSVWDLEKQAWRGFRNDSIISWRIVS